MGAINYKTSDYITLGLKPFDADIYAKDANFLSYIAEAWQVDITDEAEVEKAAQEAMQIDYISFYNKVERTLNNYDFYYFDVSIKSGYYEGYYIDIGNDFPVALDSCEDRNEANKEATRLKNFLIDCANLGMVQCFPGWCTGYNDYNGTIKAIKNAVKEMRAEIKSIPTWSRYKKY